MTPEIRAAELNVVKNLIVGLLDQRNTNSEKLNPILFVSDLQNEL